METKQPLLSLHEHENDSSSELDSIDAIAVERMSSRPRELRRHRLQRLVRVPILIHLVLVLTYTSIFFYLTGHSASQKCDERDLIYSPARSALEYEKKVFRSDLFNNSFTGQPRPELDDAWHRLLRNIHIKVPKEDIDRINGSSLALADGSGHVASLEVYHDLHCLKRVRQWIFRDVYFPNMTQEEYDRNFFHMDHCLEHFREVFMCRGDIALTTFFYRPGAKVAAKLLAEHECVNWDKLDSWTADRRIDLKETILIPPENE